jgi:fructokinase
MDERPIVGFGELLWDIFPDGSKRPGGAPFNFAFHCHQLGHQTVIVSRVGDDPLGNALLEFVRGAGLSTDYIQLDPTHKTGQVDVSLDANGVPSYEFNARPAWQHLEWSDQLDELAKHSRVLCHGSLAMLGQTKDCLVRLIATLDPHSQLHLCDLNLRSISPEPCSDCVNADWLKLNEEELRYLLPASKDLALTPKEQESLIARLREFGPLADNVLILTRGERGASIYLKDSAIHCEPPKVTIVDTVGAGDAFTAALTCQRLSGCEYRGGTPRFEPSELA